MTASLLSIRDYPGLEPVRLDPGEVVVVRGVSGSGKTRLLKRIIDLDPEPEGDIRLRGTDVRAIPITELRRSAGYLGQHPAVFPLTGRELVDRVLSLGVHAERVGPRAALEARLEALDIGHLARRPMSEYSGGELRRFALALVLHLEPDLILLDEPTSGLDRTNVRAVEAAVAPALERGAAVVWVTHERAPTFPHTTLELEAPRR